MPFGRAWFAKPKPKDLASLGHLPQDSATPFDAFGKTVPGHPLLAKAEMDGVDIFAKAPKRVAPAPPIFEQIVNTPGWSTSANPRFGREKEMEHITLSFSTIDRISAFAPKEATPRPALHFNDHNEMELRLRRRKNQRQHAKAWIRQETDETGVSPARARFVRGAATAAAVGRLSISSAAEFGAVVPVRNNIPASSFWRTKKGGQSSMGDSRPATTSAGKRLLPQSRRPWTEGGAGPSWGNVAAPADPPKAGLRGMFGAFTSVGSAGSSS